MKNLKSKVTKNPPAVFKNGNIENIEVLWGISPKKKRADTIEEYEEVLRKMTEFDLEKHAFEYEVSPGAPREIIISQLLGLYRVTQKNNLEPLPKISKELNKKLIELTKIS